MVSSWPWLSLTKVTKGRDSPMSFPGAEGLPWVFSEYAVTDGVGPSPWVCHQEVRSASFRNFVTCRSLSSPASCSGYTSRPSIPLALASTTLGQDPGVSLSFTERSLPANVAKVATTSLALVWKARVFGSESSLRFSKLFSVALIRPHVCFKEVILCRFCK